MSKKSVIDNYQINENQLATIYKTNNIIEVITIEKRCTNISNYRKVNKYGCVNIETGEFIQNKINEKTIEDLQARMKKSSNELRRIINFNYTGNHTEKFITLTYDCKMYDYKQVNSDFKKFWSRFTYAYPNCEYIRVVEPQLNGSFHIHVLVKRKDYINLFIPNENLSEIWGKGGTWIKPLPFAENFGAYFCTKFSQEDSDDSNKSKSYDKGIRINCYPDNFRLYTCSKGIKKPKSFNIKYRDLKDYVGVRSPRYEFTKTIKGINEVGEEVAVNHITFEQYDLSKD